MAENRERKLDGVPTYEAPGSEPGFGETDEDGYLIGEVVEDAPGMGARAAAGARETAHRVRTHGVRDTFVSRPRDRVSDALGGPRTRRGKQKREQRDAGRDMREERRSRDKAAKEQQKARRQERESLRAEAKRSPEAELRLNIIEARERFEAEIRKSALLSEGHTDASRRKQLTGMHQIYASMMVLQCIEPLRRGIGAQNVVQALGMSAAMWAMSPAFRTQLGSFAGSLGDAIKGRIDAKGEKLDAKAQRKHDKLSAKGHEDRLGRKWRRRLERIEKAERGDRLPFTAESAALVEVGLAEQAYAAMRTEGADPSQVEDTYRSLVSGLYGMAAEDGVEAADISRAMRTVVGQRIAEDPGMASAYTGLSHGLYQRTGSREVDGRQVWAGEFSNPYIGKVVSGSFAPRPPMTLEGHRAEIVKTIYADVASVTNEGELNDVLAQYIVGSSTDAYPEGVDAVGDPVAQARLSKTRTMFDSMHADGLSADDRHAAYSFAFQDAVDLAQRTHPELHEAWSRKFGDTWQADFERAMREYRDVGERARHAQGPDSAPRGYPEGWDDRGEYHDPYDDSSDEDIVDAEIVYDEEDDLDGPVSESERSRQEAEDRIKERTARSEKGKDIELRSTQSKIRRAKVNQHYNEIETGDFTGIGRDDAAPLQDVDFELGG